MKSVEKLTEFGKELLDVHRTNEYHQTPFLYALQSGTFELVKHLVENSAKYGWNVDINTCDEHGASIAHFAMLHNSFETLDKILKVSRKDIDLNKQDRRGYTPLHYGINARTMYEDDSVWVEAESDEEKDSNAVVKLKSVPRVDSAFKCFQRLLSEPGIDVNIKSHEEFTPLLRAIVFQRYEYVEYLIKSSGKFGWELDLDACDQDGDNALYYAVSEGEANILKLLLETNHFDLNSQGSAGSNPLLVCAKSSKDDLDTLECLKLLLTYDNTKSSSSSSSNNSNTTNENDESKDELKTGRKKVNINVSDKDGFTPFIYCLMLRKRECANFVIENCGNEIDWLATDRNGNDAVYYAVSQANSEVIELMFKNKSFIAAMNSIHNKTYAINQTYPKKGRFLKINHTSDDSTDSDNDDDENGKDRNGSNALQRAVLGALKGSKGSILHICANYVVRHQSDLQIFQKLLEIKNIDVNTRDQFGNTPLMLAVLRGKFEFVKYLMENNGKKKWKVDLNAVDNEGYNCLHVAAMNLNDLMVGYLVKFVDVNSVGSKDGNTALQLCIVEDNGQQDSKCLECIKLLMDVKGIKTDIKNKAGKNVVEMCKEEKLDKCLALIQEH